jgi:hypothetical protein
MLLLSGGAAATLEISTASTDIGVRFRRRLGGLGHAGKHAEVPISDVIAPVQLGYRDRTVVAMHGTLSGNKQT